MGAMQGASGNFLGLQRVNERASAGSGGPTALKKRPLGFGLRRVDVYIESVDWREKKRFIFSLSLEFCKIEGKATMHVEL